MRVSRIGFSLVCACALTLAACPAGKKLRHVSFDPDMDLFSPAPDGTAPGSSARTFECTQRAQNGDCLQNVCKQGPGGATYDCASYAAACVDAGEHWSGTKEGGKCTKVL